MKDLWVGLCVLTLSSVVANSCQLDTRMGTRGGLIAARADQCINTDMYAFHSPYGPGKFTNKCNIFVADVVRVAGGRVPDRPILFYFREANRVAYHEAYNLTCVPASKCIFLDRHSWRSPIGAGEWSNPNSVYLHRDPRWIRVDTPALGDVAGCKGHCAIVTGPGKTTSVGSIWVEKDDWGFRPGQNTVFWRYIGP
ncbi:hypothetical protein CAPTEDRAFT_218634 [Capitella teleta]|uniref:Peptidase C51 domain-containing protein n=1 Tax=Capitella teleta TaxID=283909 RepID=R7UEX5_CAPTE|nr:hypothetical protein CAPTEDRAFT_218634 [Capitella teleta]|eukprot:ELU05064.1 hypothetical protein CAPTEDRAFT_218634 [Capitella teleta]